MLDRRPTVAMCASVCIGFGVVFGVCQYKYCMVDSCIYSTVLRGPRTIFLVDTRVHCQRTRSTSEPSQRRPCASPKNAIPRNMDTVRTVSFGDGDKK